MGVHAKTPQLYRSLDMMLVQRENNTARRNLGS
jgi:hypothetical protein